LSRLTIPPHGEQVGSGGALLDYDTESSTVVLKADKYYVEGDTVAVCDNLSRPNGELLLSCGFVDDVSAPAFLPLCGLVLRHGERGGA
jgi:hypothetical protein